MKEQSNNILKFSSELKNALGNTKKNRIRLGIETRKILGDSVIAYEICGKIAKDIEFLFNGTINEKTFRNRLKDIEKEFDSKIS